MAKSGPNILIIPRDYLGNTHNIQLGSTGFSTEQSKSQTMAASV